MKVVRIANGAGFLGDRITAPRELVDAAQVDYLSIEHLAELTMSILARQREKDPRAGYAEDFVEIIRNLCEPLQRQPQLKIIANSGGMNPIACAAAVSQVLKNAGLGNISIGVVSGDDLLPQLDSILAAAELKNLDTGEPLSVLPREKIVSANAYLGAQPIVAALAAGARIVITGRVADASLTVAPLVHEFGWQWNELPKIASATVAGHLIECGAQVTGGYATDWENSHLVNVGYPIAEVNAAGETIITKPAKTGGCVTFRTVAEQLVYEIGDPRHYLTPDIDCDFTTVQLRDLGNDQVQVSGASGLPATDTYKVSLAYRDGFMASGQLLVYGLDCPTKAQACGEMILQRTAAAGFSLARTNIELLGQGAGVPGSWFWRKYQPPGELMLRVTVHDPNRAAVEHFTREIAPLITSGPAGLAGYAAGRPQVRPGVRLLAVARSQVAGQSASRHAFRGGVARMTSGQLIFVRDLATARSGDKGNHANIGVVAKDAESYEILRSRLTAVRVQSHFAGLGVTRVERFELPLIGSLNFLLYDALGGGASRSLRIDTQGKLLATSLLDLQLRLAPETF